MEKKEVFWIFLFILVTVFLAIFIRNNFFNIPSSPGVDENLCGKYQSILCNDRNIHRSLCTEAGQLCNGGRELPERKCNDLLDEMIDTANILSENGCEITCPCYLDDPVHNFGCNFISPGCECQNCCECASCNYCNDKSGTFSGGQIGSTAYLEISQCVFTDDCPSSQGECSLECTPIASKEMINQGCGSWATTGETFKSTISRNCDTGDWLWNVPGLGNQEDYSSIQNTDLACSTGVDCQCDERVISDCSGYKKQVKCPGDADWHDVVRITVRSEFFCPVSDGQDPTPVIPSPHYIFPPSNATI